jgi:hypothetical protein
VGVEASEALSLFGVLSNFARSDISDTRFSIFGRNFVVLTNEASGFRSSISEDVVVLGTVGNILSSSDVGIALNIRAKNALTIVGSELDDVVSGITAIATSDSALLGDVLQKLMSVDSNISEGSRQLVESRSGSVRTAREGDSLASLVGVQIVSRLAKRTELESGVGGISFIGNQTIVSVSLGA